MSAGQKVAVSLLISVLLFAAVAVAVFAGLFSFVEARFYQPLVVRTIEQRLEVIATKEQEYSDTLMQRFAAFATEKSVATYASARPTAEDQKNRTSLTGTLFAETPALRGIRVVDANGRNVHFSSYAADVKSKTNTQIAYTNYGDLHEIPFEAIACADTRSGAEQAYKIVRDQNQSRVIYAFPFYDTYAAYRGTIAFYCDSEDFNRFLLSQMVSSLHDSGMLVSAAVTAEGKNIGGYLFGLPAAGGDVLTRALLEKMATPHAAEPSVFAFAHSSPFILEKLAVAQAGTWVAFVRLGTDGGFVARVVRDDVLVFPPAVRLLLLAIVFATLFLITFLLCNVRQDDTVIIQERVHRFQTAFLDEYMEKKERGELTLLPQDIASRRAALSMEIKKSLGSRAKKHEQEVDRLLDRSWNEIAATLGVTAAIAAPAADTAELKRMLEEVLSSRTVQLQSVQRTSPAPVAPAHAVEAAHGAEAAEPIEEAEELEEMEALEEAEPVEEVEELEEVETLEEVAAVDEVEMLEEAEVADEIEVLEEVAPVDNAEALEEIEPVEELASVEEDALLKEAESLEEAELVEELAPVEDVAVAPTETAVSERDMFAEPLTFSSPVSPSAAEAAEADSPAAEQPFEISSPVALFDDIEELPSAHAPAEDTGFLFSGFGRNDTPVTEVLADEPSEPIVADEDGTYHIASRLPTSTVKLDDRFKALVDSVLG